MDQHVYDWGEKKNRNQTRCCRWKSMCECKSQFISRNKDKAQALKLWNRLALFQKIATFVVFLFFLTTFVSRGACNIDTTSFTAVPFEKLQMVSSTDKISGAAHGNRYPLPDLLTWFCFPLDASWTHTGTVLFFFLWTFQIRQIAQVHPFNSFMRCFLGHWAPAANWSIHGRWKTNNVGFFTLLFFSQLSDNSCATAPVFSPDIYLLALVFLFFFFSFDRLKPNRQLKRQTQNEWGVHRLIRQYVLPPPGTDQPGRGFENKLTATILGKFSSSVYFPRPVCNTSEGLSTQGHRHFPPRVLDDKF